MCVMCMCVCVCVCVRACVCDLTQYRKFRITEDRIFSIKFSSDYNSQRLSLIRLHFISFQAFLDTFLTQVILYYMCNFVFCFLSHCLTVNFIK